jgi:hypothetical protein
MKGDLPKKAEGALDRLVDQARQDLEPRVSDAAWSAMEERLMARMTAERAALVDEVNVTSIASRRRARFFQIGAAALAVAAAIAVFVRKDQAGSGLGEGQASIVADPSVSALRSTEGAGSVRVSGVAASPGLELRAGDVIEVDGARAVLERPRKVQWLLERTAPGAAGTVGRARVKSAGESLVLGLDDGAIEAQVTPVPSGEAFAIDIATEKALVRVAVHGTHLRVARTGSQVTVDLSEGVVSIGAPPRAGSTYGTLVTAPSHVEFDAASLDSTLKVDHAPASVRAAVALAPHEAPVAARTEPVNVAPPAANEAAPGVPATVPRPEGPRGAAPTRPEVVKPTGKPAISAREAIAVAIRECAAARRRPENVRVTVSSSLTLKIAAGGAVETARFEPPLLPEIQTCAAAAIYKAQLEDSAGGSVTIPIDFTY